MSISSSQVFVSLSFISLFEFCSALEPWSVGVGGQGGDPSVYHQKFEPLKRKQNLDEIYERKKMVECGVLKETGS